MLLDTEESLWMYVDGRLWDQHIRNKTYPLNIITSHLVADVDSLTHLCEMGCVLIIVQFNSMFRRLQVIGVREVGSVERNVLFCWIVVMDVEFDLSASLLGIQTSNFSHHAFD